MKPTARESAAAQSLATAFLEFILAHEEGQASRRAQRPRDEVAVRVEHVHPARDVEAKPARTPVAPERGLLTVKQAADYLQIGQRLLWSMSAPRGPLPVVKLGRSVRYALVDLEATLQRMRIKPYRSVTPQ